jgi:hypothetical protein
MDLSLQTIELLNNLVQDNAELRSQIESAPDLQVAAQILFHAAQSKGIQLELTALDKFLRETIEGSSQLQTEELDAVVAGRGGSRGGALRVARSLLKCISKHPSMQAAPQYITATHFVNSRVN